MISARLALISHLRRFFETELCGIVPWGAIKVAPGLPAMPVLSERGKPRRNPEGKLQEIVTITFRDYEMTVQSPNADPPLGWIRLTIEGWPEEGPLDQTTWARLGAVIRNREARKLSYGDRTSSPGSTAAA